MNMKKLEQLYEGKAKKVFLTDDPDVLIVDYKDDATAEQRVIVRKKLRRTVKEWRMRRRM